MEAATPLNLPRVRTLGDRLLVDGLLVDDETAVRLVRDREETGDDPVRVVTDAIEIGARVLDREQTGANAEFVKTEFEKVSGEVQRAFSEKAEAAAEVLEQKLASVFDADGGHLAKELERLFSDGSSVAVQHRVRELVAETMVKSREDLLKQFSAADGQNPLADFKEGTVQALNRASSLQQEQNRATLEKLAALEKELQGLRDEKQKQIELADVEDKGTAKGRPYEDAVFDAIDCMAAAQGDDAEAVGDARGATGKKGDVVVEICAADGPCRGRIAFEAKNSKLSKPEALRQLDDAKAEREADAAVLVVSHQGQLPAKTASLREYGGDKLFAVYDPEEGSTLELEVAYKLARARVLMRRGESDGVDVAAIRQAVERAQDAMTEVRKIKQQLSAAKTSIDKGAGFVGDMADRVRALLAEIDTHTAAAEAADDA